ncbi:unnamed protein product, partial [Rotaria sp. Silwood1]
KLRPAAEFNRSFDTHNDDNEQEIILPHGHLINSSKNLFSNLQLRSRIYEQQQFVSNDGTVKTVYYFRATRICVDESGPFWPMTFLVHYHHYAYRNYD